MEVTLSPPHCTVYALSFENGKKYIGITSLKPECRWRNGRGYNKGSYIRNAIDKYGWENIDKQIVASGLTREEAQHFERLLVTALRTNEPEFGYNSTNGGEKANTGVMFTEPAKRKMSESHVKTWKDQGHPWVGKHHTEETKLLISKHRSGKLVGEDNPFYGRKHSEKSLKMMSEQKKKYYSEHKNPNRQPVRCIETGKVYETAREASRDTGARASSIGAAAHGRLKRAGKLHWEFVNKESLEHGGWKNYGRHKNGT